jgi:hypothetical protein
MKTEISHEELEAAGWDHKQSDWYYFSPTWGSDTHIHMGGNNISGTLRLKYISLKVKDSFAGKIFDEDRMIMNWGLLEDSRSVPFDVAIEFRRALRVAM